MKCTWSSPNTSHHKQRLTRLIKAEEAKPFGVQSWESILLLMSSTISLLRKNMSQKLQSLTLTAISQSQNDQKLHKIKPPSKERHAQIIVVVHYCNQSKHWRILYAQNNVAAEVPVKKSVFFRAFNHENVWKAPIKSVAYQTLAGLRPNEWAVGRLNWIPKSFCTNSWRALTRKSLI